MSELQFPWVRDELIDYLYSLSDREYQMSCWIRGECPGDVQYDCLDLSIHFLFDDFPLAEDARSCIGVMLHNAEEAALVSEVCRQIDIIFDRYGTELSDKEYINCPEWDGVLMAAKRAHTALCRHDDPDQTRDNS